MDSKFTKIDVEAGRIIQNIADKMDKRGSGVSQVDIEIIASEILKLTNKIKEEQNGSND